MTLANAIIKLYGDTSNSLAELSMQFLLTQRMTRTDTINIIGQFRKKSNSRVAFLNDNSLMQMRYLMTMNTSRGCGKILDSLKAPKGAKTTCICKTKSMPL